MSAVLGKDVDTYPLVSGTKKTANNSPQAAKNPIT
jgi:hypothetical protein